MLLLTLWGWGEGTRRTGDPGLGHEWVVSSHETAAEGVGGEQLCPTASVKFGLNQVM